MSRKRTATLSKSRFVAGCQCLKHLYWHCYERERAGEIGASTQAILEQGQEVGRMARDAFAGGVLVEEDYTQHDAAVASTTNLLADGSIPAVFEAAFRHEDILIRTDVLKRLPGNRWHLIEVKSTSEVKDHHVPDVAIQRYVLEKGGLDVASASVMHLDTSYVYDGKSYDLDALFAISDVKEELQDVMLEVPERLACQHSALAMTVPPDVAPGPQCRDPYKCEFFGCCNPALPPDHVSLLPRLSRSKAEALAEMGVESIRDVPEDFPLTDLQRRICTCVQTGQPYLSEELRRELSGLRYPLCFMDFETTNPAIPRYAGMSPFNMIPFQCSVHVRREPKGQPEHHEFLADTPDDSRETFIASLLGVLEQTDGHIVVYSRSFESGRLNDLARWCPKYAARIERVQDRLWDLLAAVRRHVYYPDFCGSFSMKAVLPALVPEMDYASMEVSDGAQAGVVYNELVRTAPTDLQRDALRRALLAYCGQDSLGMLKLVDRLGRR